MSKNRWDHPKNDGWNDVEYEFCVEPELNAKLSHILNEACHVFYHHADGYWQSRDKDRYAQMLAPEIVHRPSLTKRLLGTGDRVVKMVTYRALELTTQKDIPPSGE